MKKTINNICECIRFLNGLYNNTESQELKNKLKNKIKEYKKLIQILQRKDKTNEVVNMHENDIEMEIKDIVFDETDKSQVAIVGVLKLTLDQVPLIKPDKNGNIRVRL